jgi:hypothetical protein
LTPLARRNILATMNRIGKQFSSPVDSVKSKFLTNCEFKRGMVVTIGVSLGLILSGSLCATPAADIIDIVNQVQAENLTPSLDSYRDFFTLLPVNSGVQRGYSGPQAQPDLLAARSTIYQALTDLLGPAGGTVSYQDFTQSGYAGRNIVGVLPGQDPGNTRQYVIGAHYDSVGNPGADDNASGVAGMLEAAYVLSQHQFASTLVFVAFDLEEEGLWGSQVYAAAAQNNHDNIQGMVSMDMIAFNNPANPNTAEICRAYDNGVIIQNEVYQAFGDYTTLNLTLNPATIVYSDHGPFSDYGYPAALVIDDLDGNNNPTNPYYHTANDFYLNNGTPQQYGGLAYLDLDYAADLTRGVVAWAADEGGLSNAPESGKTGLLLGSGWLAMAALRRLTGFSVAPQKGGGPRLSPEAPSV